MRKCDNCGKGIPKVRLDAIPETKWCVKCAEKYGPQKLKGFLVFDHKTAPVLVTIDPRDKEAIRRASRADRRER